ncbi:hypothetical protein BCV70DRAFT_197342 [Testicularia cyperi]|uniref:non-specific serine/threonine protein kinase n=1 Tax=Testicularia cyperi TaxID=1882483 RepID=A0A317XYY2_9BASI|nr:hypothetical protein BCV70DRAFT_197342 [Testicularia cyperi]
MARRQNDSADTTSAAGGYSNSDPALASLLKTLLGNGANGADDGRSSRTTASRRANGQPNTALDPSSVLAVASQYIAEDRLSQMNPHRTSGPGGSSEEAVNHLVNQMLIAVHIVPLVRSPMTADIVSGKVAAGPIQALDTLSQTLKGSPKFLEHLFATPELHHQQDQSTPADSLGDYVGATTCTFDVWASPRLLCASASMTAAAYQQPSGPRRQALLDLGRRLLEGLRQLLSVSIDAAGQIDNVRYILADCLRASVHALALSGRTAFTTQIRLPDYMVPEQTLEPAPPAVHFFRADERRFAAVSAAFPFRLSSRSGRPKPSGTGLNSLAPDQADTRFCYPLQIDANRVATSDPMSISDAVFPSAATPADDRAQALFLTSIELCLQLAAVHADVLLDIVEDAMLILTDHLQHTWTIQKQQHLHPAVKFTTSRLFLLHGYRVLTGCTDTLTVLFQPSMSQLLRICIEYLLSLLESHEETSLTIASRSDDAMHAYNTITRFLQACDTKDGFILEPSELEQLSTHIRPCIVLLSAELQILSDEFDSGYNGLYLAKLGCVARALLFAVRTGNFDGVPEETAVLCVAKLQNSIRETSDYRGTAQGNRQHQGCHKADVSNIAKDLDELQARLQRRNEIRANGTPSAKRRRLSPLRSDKNSDSQRRTTLRKLDGAALCEALADCVSRVDAGSTNVAKNGLDHVRKELRLRRSANCFCNDAVLGSVILSLSGGVTGVYVCRCQDTITSPLYDGDEGCSRHSWDGSAAQRDAIQTLLYELDRVYQTPVSTATRILDSLIRFVQHTSLSEPLLPGGEAQLLQLISAGLRSRSRQIRLLVNDLACAVQMRLVQQRDAVPEDEWSRRLDCIPAAYADVLKQGARSSLKVCETALLGLARLSALPVESSQERCIMELLLQLGNSNPFLKSCAYTHMVQLAAEQRCTTFQLIRPHLEKVSTTIVERFMSTPDLWTGFLSLIKMSQSAFFNATIEYTLPHLIGMICTGQAEAGSRMIELIARALATDVPRLCLANITPIFRSFFMRTAAVRDRGLNKLVELISVDAANLRALLRSRQSDVVGYLVVKLGNRATRKEAYEGLEFIIETIHIGSGSDSTTMAAAAAARNSKEAHSRKAKVASFLKSEILAVLTWINQELSGEHGRRTAVDRAHAIRSIGALVEIIGPPISAVTPQIMATLNSHLQSEPLALAILESWRIFITTLRFDDIGPFVGQTAAALLSAWSGFNSEKKRLAVAILQYLILENAEYLKAYVDDVPSLDRLDAEIPDVCRALRSMRDSWNHDRLFGNILDRAAHENISICSESLEELFVFLTEERTYVEGLIAGDAFSPLVGRCVRTLMQIAVRSDTQQTKVRDLCFRCFGLVGAVDPDRIEHAIEEPLKVVLNNFEDPDESADFALHLIRDLLVPAFRAADDTTHQSGLAYAIQELLKAAGFTSALLSTGSNTRPVSIKTRQRMAELPQDVVDTITPLLDSKYMVQVGRSTLRAMPIYRNTTSFRDWLQSWANRLIVGILDRHEAISADCTVSRAHETAATIFGVFRIAIRDHDTGIARHLLPHLVLHSIISGDSADREAIVEEMQTILSDQVDPQTGVDRGHHDAERRLLTAQTLFKVMDHIGVWMRRKRQDLSKSSRRPRNAAGGEDALSEVEQAMKCISQELMAHASLQCKAYSRALLNFENRVRSMRLAGKRDDDLQPYYEDLHRIYAQLDEPDGMEGISARVISPSLEHQIREHESTGRWTSAQSCWEVELQRRPDDVDLHLGLLRCLRNLGHYDTMRTHIRGALSAHPEWEDLLDAFRVEGACILGDWAEVQSRVTRAQATSPEHSIGRALLAMRSSDDEAFQATLTRARQEMGQPLLAAGKASYPAIYDAVLNLHMLHELEMIRNPSLSRAGSVTTRASGTDLQRSLAARLNATLPSFRTQEPLLSLRRTAFSALLPHSAASGVIVPMARSSMSAATEVGEAWISTAKIARRAGHIQTAYSAMLQATQHQATFAFVQRVKLLAKEEQTHAAIQDLNNSLYTLVARFKPGQVGHANNDGPIELQTTDAASGRPLRIDRASFAKACLLRARLLDSTFRYTPNEILDKYKEAAKEQANSEKVWYHLGHFQDAHEGLLPNSTMQRFNVCRSFLRSAQLGTKFFYRTLPRVLTIWMDIAADEQIMAASRRGAGGDSALAQKLEAFDMLNTLMKKSSRKIKPFQWLAVFPQLVARIVQKNEDSWQVLQDMVLQVLVAYPQQAMWSMVAGSNSKDSDRRRRYGEIVARLSGKSSGAGSTTHLKEVIKVVTASQRLARELLRLCDHQVGKSETTMSMERQFPGLLEVATTSDLLLPLQSSMTVLLPSNHLISDTHRPFPPNLPMIRTFDDHIEVMNSLQKPRKVTIVGSDGQRYAFLCKPKDDLRKDARLMEFDAMINKLLQSQPESRRRKLYVRTYAVLILNEEHGLIEWVPNTVGFRHILTKMYSAKGMHIYSGEVKTNMDEARLSPDPRTTQKIFEERVLARFPPVFYEWFLATFPDPTAWLKARSAYARTAAVMSMVGFVLGLGDRHGENILFDSVSGDTVHVDLNCLFDKGQRFEIPERVPFRLTQNMVDAMGVTGCDGAFRKSAEITMGILRANKDSLMSVLEAMVHDPLGEWSVPEDRHRSRHSTSRQDPRVVEARRALDPIANKLDGRIYRLGVRDPTPPHTTNNLVDALIKEATSPVNLAKMYIGWSSWL